jgi:hypothetical protein
MAMPPAVSSLLSFPSSSQSVLFAREPPTERENGPRAETSLLGHWMNILGKIDSKSFLSVFSLQMNGFRCRCQSRAPKQQTEGFSDVRLTLILVG